MIRWIDSEKLQNDALRFCENSLCGVRIASFLKAYGYGYQFARFWVQESNGNITAVLSCVDSVATVEAKNHADFKELRAFLPFSEMKTLFSSKQIAEKLGLNVISCSNSMVYSGENKVVNLYDIIENPDLKEVYTCLSSSFDDLPSFSDWLPDVSHRVRHNTASAFAIKEDDKCVSVAMAVAKNETGVILGGVATLPQCRNKGHGGSIVADFADRYYEEGKTVYLCCENDKIRFYERLGFIKKEKYTISTF